MAVQSTEHLRPFMESVQLPCAMQVSKLTYSLLQTYARLQPKYYKAGFRLRDADAVADGDAAEARSIYLRPTP